MIPAHSQPLHACPQPLQAHGEPLRRAVPLAFLAPGAMAALLLFAVALERVAISLDAPLLPLLAAGGCGVTAAAALLLLAMEACDVLAGEVQT